MSDESRGARKEPQGSPGRGAPISAAEFAGVGAQFAATILVFVYAGIWLDKRLGTSPWFLILLVFVGAAAGFFSIYHKVMAAQRREDRRKPR